MSFNIRLKNRLVLIISFLFFNITYSQIVNIPDVNFKNRLLYYSVADTDGDGNIDDYIDVNNDGEIQISEAEAVIKLSVQHSNIMSLEGIEKFINLTHLYCGWNNLTELHVDMLTGLYNLDCRYNNLITLDLNGLTNLTILNCQNNDLESLFIKNGYHSQFFTIIYDFNDPTDNGNLQYICEDAEWTYLIQNWWDNAGVTTCVINSYCSFVPGLEFFTIEGANKFDIDNNGCDVNDPIYPNLHYNITDGTSVGDIISDISGEYFIPIQEGVHTITPILYNTNYFSVTPSSISVDFPTEDSPYQQDFCVSPLGTHNDLEIVIIPLQAARPGFDTDYKVVYWNKGNTILSGIVYFDFNEPAGTMSFVSSTPIHETLEDNLLSWSYTDLIPFETREIFVTLNMNSPMDTPPLNGGDDIGFVADIYPKDIDETSNDNNFQLKETVVNSYDPNDKTCLEGETITPEQVGKYLHYLIRFENTGTASAVNIVVKDIIDTNKLDVSTLVPLHSSHDFWTRINDNVVEFIFEDINLPFDDANNDGYIAFKIKTLDTLVLDDTIDNNAEIYFDYNFPIITNTSQVTVATLSSEDFVFNSINLYPNPTKNILNIEATNTIESIVVFNLLGQQILSFKPNTLTEEIDMKGLNSGMYLVTITIGEQTATYKVVKE